MLSFFKQKPVLKDLIPNNFVDIHSHLLPGIDDGAKTIEIDPNTNVLPSAPLVKLPKAKEEKHETMNDEKATALVNATISNHEAFSKLQRKAFKEMSKAITPLRASQFIQFENFLETAIRSEISEQLPFIKAAK